MTEYVAEKTVYNKTECSVLYSYDVENQSYYLGEYDQRERNFIWHSAKAYRYRQHQKMNCFSLYLASESSAQSSFRITGGNKVVVLFANRRHFFP